ncbi:threonine synthase [Celerinatantimonas sp. MCCC 1A17872]|uniref:threonine synthase n=1 Tax=Celerinatantimonas sp. MCCC 1A17872 TaxID=3177514 RepID=UPI0038C5BA6B
MKLYNIKCPEQQVSFAQAVQIGLGKQQGLFFPSELVKLENIDELLSQDFVTRSSAILHHLIGDELSLTEVTDMVSQAFSFAAPIANVSDNVAALELFHGPTLAFKDFGARFMAQCLKRFSKGRAVTILTATSGDTGAAVAHAFYGIENIKVVVLYPEGKISELQEKLFCTLGNNITTVAVKSDFDACQSLVKQAFDDQALREDVGLNSANSINISRLLAQVCYYFEALAQLPKEKRNNVVFSVPSGNFGNLTAGLIAQSLGLPVKRFIAATNVNDTVPRYLADGQWLPHPTVATLSNAMDVSQPNNWPRIEELFKVQNRSLSELGFGALTDEQTREAMVALYQQGYVSEPHGAIAWQQLSAQLNDGEQGIFLCTAHPAKFKSVVDAILPKPVELPDALAQRIDLPLLSKFFPAEFAPLKELLMQVSG